MTKLSYSQGLTWLMILFVVPLPLIQSLALGLPAIYASSALAIQLGVIAYVWWLAAIYLATRPRWLDRLIGLPSVYMIHGMLSILALILAYLHKTQTQSYGWIKRTGDWAFDLLLLLICYSLVFLAGWLTQHSAVLRQLKRTLERLFHHELTVWLHRLNLVAVGLVFIHVQLISYITQITTFIWLFNGYTAVVLLLYLWQKVHQTWYLPTAKLVAKRQIAPNFYEFTLQLRHPNTDQIRPGDYLFVNFPHYPGLRELHPFSVVYPVTATGHIVLAIRGDGDFTRQIQALSLGVSARISGGYGRFAPVIQANATDDLVLVGGGSGIVPLLALIAAYPQKTITLYYTAHTAAALIYAADLRALATKRANFTLHLQVGRWNVNRLVPQIVAPQTTYLLSGPAALGHAWQRALARQRVAARKVYYEEFTW